MAISDATELICRSCSSRYAHGPLYHGCPRCAAPPRVVPSALVVEAITSSPDGRRPPLPSWPSPA